MSLRINDEIPNLKVVTDHGEMQLHDYIGDNWGILFSHPKDFTPVCTTEFSAVAKLSDAWEKRKTKVIGISVDSAEDHVKWKEDIEKFGGSKAGFPIIADTDLKVAKAFDMLPSEAHLPEGRTPADSATVRSVFIVPLNSTLKDVIKVVRDDEAGHRDVNHGYANILNKKEDPNEDQLQA